MNYPKPFDTWWSFFCSTSPSKKGSKFEAYMVWDDLSKKGFLPDLQEILDGVQACANNDEYFRAKKEFVGSWKHGCRWLSNRCWEVEDEGEHERNKKIRARQRQVDIARDKERDKYGSWMSEQTDEEYANYVSHHGHHLDWLRQEVSES